MFISDVLSPYSPRKTAPLVASIKRQGVTGKYAATTMVRCALLHTHLWAPLNSLRFHLVCHHFCPQALAEALKVNKSVRVIDLPCTDIRQNFARAWCLARRVCGSRVWNCEIKLEPSGVPEVFETCETLVVFVDWGSGVRLLEIFGSFQKGFQTGWKYGSKKKVGQG